MIHESGIIPSNKQKGALRSCTNGRFLKAGKRNSLGGQWLEHSASATEGLGSIPSQGTKIPHASQCSQKSLKIRKERDKEVKMKKKKKTLLLQARSPFFGGRVGVYDGYHLTGVGQEIPG